MSEKKNSIWFNIDWLTVGLYFLLVVLGWFNIYSAVYAEDRVETFDFTMRYGRQLLWIIASLFIIGGAFVIDSKFYSTFAYPIYGFFILILLAVLAFGTEINGAKSWFVIGSVRLQPSEFVKFATALALSKYLSRHNFNPKSLKSVLIFSSIALLPFLLIYLQNDLGSALVFFVLFLVFFREGMSPTYLVIALLLVIVFVLSLVYESYIVFFILEILAFIAFFVLSRRSRETLIGAGVLLVTSGLIWIAGLYLAPNLSKSLLSILALLVSSVWFVFKLYKNKISVGFNILLVLFASIAFSYSVNYAFDNFLDGYKQKRIKVLLGLEEDPYGAGYNVHQSLIAIGSGGPLGKGYLQGTQTKFKFVPEQSTDFIFCTVGEEWGFLGTSVVLLLFLALLLRLIYLAERQKSKFSRVYGYCVASIIFFHVAINVGMTIGLAPVIGIPLPFFSYGGSSLWGFTFLLFIFLKLDSNRSQLIN